MPFIGTQPDVGGYSVLDALTASATASYTLQKDSANFVPSSANQLLVSLNGVIQKPGSSFTVSGSTLTFSSALTSSDSIDFIISMGEPLLIGTPSDATVTGNKLASNIGISTTGNIATTGSGTLTSAGLITASSGVAIGGTGAANTLDDYEEGTHDCTVTMASGTVTLNPSYNKIKYTKVGRNVTIQGQINVQSVSSPSGLMTISMPFTMDTTSDEGANVGGGVIRAYNADVPTGGLYLFGAMVFNQGANMQVEWVKDNSPTVNHVPKAGEYLIMSFSYTTA